MRPLASCAVLAAAGFWPLAAYAQRLGGGGGGADVSIVRVLAAFAVCIAAALALALVIKGKQRPFAAGWLARSIRNARRIEVVEARRLSQFAELCLVRCDGVEYLLLCGASGQRILRSDPVADPAGRHDGES